MHSHCGNHRRHQQHAPLRRALPSRSGYDRISEEHVPKRGLMAEYRKWGLLSKDGSASMANLTLHAAVPINYSMPADGDSSVTLPYRVHAFGSGHRRGANFAFADGDVRFLSDSTSLETLKA